MAHIPPVSIHDVETVEIGQPREIAGNSGPFATSEITFTGIEEGHMESVTVQIYGESDGGLKRAMMAACNRFLEEAGQP